MSTQEVTYDGRTFEQIVAEARRRIPRYAPEWTDLNDSDPGMALVQLFAWMTEMMIFEINRAPERSREKLLELVGLQRRPAQPSIVHLAFTPRVDFPEASATVTAGWRVDAAPADGGDPVAFETTDDMDLVRLPLKAVLVSEGGAAPVEKQIEEVGPPFGTAPRLGGAIYFGFGPGDPPAGVAPFPATWRLRCSPPPPSGGRASLECPDETRPPVSPVQLVWEYKPKDSAPWRRLEVLQDDSVAFTRAGDVVLTGPPADIEASTIPPAPDPLRWVRCRLAGGAYPTARVPRVDRFTVNSVPAKSLATVRDETLRTEAGAGVSSGLPGQVFLFANRPIAEDDLVLEVIEGDEDDPTVPPVTRTWRRVRDLQEAEPLDEVFVLDPGAGSVRFGDTRIPVAGAQIVARTYRYGGGAGANIPAGSALTPNPTPPGVEEVTNPSAAAGGADAESVEELAARAGSELRRRERAVTAEDFGEVAAAVGGVLRATAIPNAHPDYPGLAVPGAVQVVVLPEGDDPKPRATAELREAVCEALEPLRLITTEVVVTEPQYVEVVVQAVVTADPARSFDDVRNQALARLRARLNPRAWEFGEAISPSVLYGDLLGPHGDVKDVQELAVTADGRSLELGSATPIPVDGLVVSGPHAVTVRPPVVG